VTTPFPEDKDAYLLGELDGNDEESYAGCRSLMNVVEKFKLAKCLAETSAQKDSYGKYARHFARYTMYTLPNPTMWWSARQLTQAHYGHQGNWEALRI